jgi:hypothetical protein
MFKVPQPPSPGSKPADQPKPSAYKIGRRRIDPYIKDLVKKNFPGLFTSQAFSVRVQTFSNLPPKDLEEKQWRAEDKYRKLKKKFDRNPAGIEHPEIHRFEDFEDFFNTGDGPSIAEIKSTKRKLEEEFYDYADEQIRSDFEEDERDDMIRQILKDMDKTPEEVEENMAEDERDYNEFRNRQSMINDEWYADQYDI